MQKQINGFQGTRSSREETYCKGAQGTFWDDRNFFSPDCGGSYEIDTFFKTHQLHTKKEWILSYVMYTSIKLIIKKKRNVFRFFLSIDPGGCPWCIVVNRRKARCISSVGSMITFNKVTLKRNPLYPSVCVLMFTSSWRILWQKGTHQAWVHHGDGNWGEKRGEIV